MNCSWEDEMKQEWILPSSKKWKLKDDWHGVENLANGTKRAAITWPPQKLLIDGVIGI
jgi:hypothetical protein